MQSPLEDPEHQPDTPPHADDASISEVGSETPEVELTAEDAQAMIAEMESLKSDKPGFQTRYFVSLVDHASNPSCMAEPSLRKFLTDQLSELLPAARGHIGDEAFLKITLSVSDLLLCSGDVVRASSWAKVAVAEPDKSAALEIESIRQLFKTTHEDFSEDTKEVIDDILKNSSLLIDRCIADNQVDGLLSLSFECLSTLESQHRHLHSAAFALKVIEAVEPSPSGNHFQLNRLRLECAKVLCKGEAISYPEEFDGSCATELLEQSLSYFRAQDYVERPQSPLLVIDCYHTLADIYSHKKLNDLMVHHSQSAYDHCIAHLIPRLDEQEWIMVDDKNCILDTIVYHAETKLEVGQYLASDEICSNGLRIAERLSESGLYLASILSVKAQALNGISKDQQIPKEEREYALEMAEECFSKAADVYDFAMNEENYFAGGECYYRFAHFLLDLAENPPPEEDPESYTTKAIDHLNRALDYFKGVQPAVSNWLKTVSSDLAYLYEQIDEFPLAEELHAQAERYGAEFL